MKARIAAGLVLLALGIGCLIASGNRDGTLIMAGGMLSASGAGVLFLWNKAAR